MLVRRTCQPFRHLVPGLPLAVVALLSWPQALEAGSTDDTGERTRVSVAIEELARAAFAGDPEASYHLGTFLALHSRGGDDLVVAEKYLRFAAEHDHVEAQHGLGMLLIGNEESDDRVDEGLYWLGSAVTQGDALSAVVLGRLYQYGMHGVPQDLCLAEDWYEVGAMLGLNPPAGYLEHMSAEQPESC